MCFFSFIIESKLTSTIYISCFCLHTYIYQREKGVVILLPKIVLRNKLIVTIPIRNKFSFIFMPYVSTVLDCLLQRLTADFEKNWGN